MARSRNIKPSFFTNDILSDCSPLARLLFIGLWTISDREGRLEDRPKKIKAELLPYDECSIEDHLNSLNDAGFIVRFTINNNQYIQIVNFTKHQNPHQKEQASTIPAPDMHQTCTGIPGTSRALTLNPLPESLIPHQERTNNPDSVVIDNPRENDKFRNIYEFGINLFPQLAPKNTSEITKWVDAGAIPTIDIYPAIRQATGKNVQSWAYFSGAVMDAKANRLKPLPKGNQNGTHRIAGETGISKPQRAAEAIARGIAKANGNNSSQE